MRPVRVSVPGKLILIGEHAVVYGRPALAAAIDKRLSVTLVPTGSGGVSLSLPGIAHAELTSWIEIAEHASRAFAAWRRFDGEPATDFSAVRGTEAAHLVKVALGAALSRAGLSPRELPGVEIDVRSHLPVGSGFGSSAAAAVGVLAAFEAAMGSATSGRDALLAAALDVERCQHGRPSGIDTETVVRGGLVWAERTAEHPDRLSFATLDSASPLLSEIAVYDTGRPRESTGEVVAAVRRVRDRDPRRFDETLDRFEWATRAFRAELETPAGCRRTLIGCLREAEACLEAMGAVPEAVARRVQAIEAAGGAAKISGAGAASGEAAGSMLVVAPEAGEAQAILEGYTRREVALGAQGLRIEEAEEHG
ncbi:MAG TPA: hypothetical protein VN851_10880 [Thermoanaerobaculia bacterium]|nr:hypothetical protein [Thermoanaerobaculia bacterium]